MKPRLLKVAWCYLPSWRDQTQREEEESKKYLQRVLKYQDVEGNCVKERSLPCCLERTVSSVNDPHKLINGMIVFMVQSNPLPCPQIPKGTMEGKEDMSYVTNIKVGN